MPLAGMNMSSARCMYRLRETSRNIEFQARYTLTPLHMFVCLAAHSWRCAAASWQRRRGVHGLEKVCSRRLCVCQTQRHTSIPVVLVEHTLSVTWLTEVTSDGWFALLKLAKLFVSLITYPGIHSASHYLINVGMMSLPTAATNDPVVTLSTANAEH